MSRAPLIILVFAITRLCSAWIEESEPNDEFWQADPVACGDTVHCAALSGPADEDCFRFTAVAGDSLILLTSSCDNSQTDTYLALFDDHDSLLAGNDNGGAAYFSHIRYAITRTAEYVTRVIQYTPSPDSTYDLMISCPHPPPEDYDLCETARVIPGLPYYNEGSTQGQTNQGGTAAPDVFYSFYNPVTGNYTIIVCSDLFDARVQILGRCVGDYWDDANEGCNLGALLNTYNLAPGQYWIMVEGTTANEIGNFSIEVTAQLPECPPPESVTLSRVGGYPFLDWQELSGPYYYIVWQSNTSNGAYEHLGTTFVTYFIDSTGYSNSRRFYQVTSVCPW